MTDLEFSQSIYIKPEEAKSFTIAWENLMSDFRIPMLHQNSLFEVMQNFFSRLEFNSSYIYDINCAIEALDFFICYTRRFNESVKHKSPIEIDTFAKVRFELAGVETEFKYPNSSQTTIKALYSYLRDYDNFLRRYLHDFEQCPSIDDLELIKAQLGDKREDSMQFSVIEQIEDLKAFIAGHLSKELSRKVNYFIFELLYLFNIIQYAGKVSKVDSKKFALSKDTYSAKFNPIIMESKDKSRYITDIISLAVKRAIDNS